MAPFESKAQVRKFGAMMGRGEISKATFEEFAHSTPDMKHLPEHVSRMKRRHALRQMKKSHKK